MTKSIRVQRGKTTYLVTFDEHGEVDFICGSAVMGKVPRHQGGTRRTVWSGPLWHKADKKPIPMKLRPIVQDAVQIKEAQI
uniref:Uncharacterized protein n=1 Tax=Caulobacter phage BL57 TaxID=3348355 RepID=A0AB74UN47_9VIRU